MDSSGEFIISKFNADKISCKLMIKEVDDKTMVPVGVLSCDRLDKYQFIPPYRTPNKNRVVPIKISIDAILKSLR